MPAVLAAMKPRGTRMMSHLSYGDKVYAFFSSVSYHLEGKGNWGKRFPRLLLDLCDTGIVEFEDLEELRAELITIEKELKKFSIHDAIYDLEDLSKPIPWELLPGAENNNLSEPWITPSGKRSFFELFDISINISQEQETCLILMYPCEMAQRALLRERKEKGREYWIKETS